MGNRSTRVLAAVAAGAMAGGLGLAGASAPQAAGAPGGLAGGAAVRGTQLWVSRHNGLAAAVAAGPDGKTVFVTGTSATIAYQAGTGARLWARHGTAVALAVSPRGGRVFVTGWSSAGGVATVACSASTGALLWAAHYHGLRGEAVSSMAISPDGTTVFITGVSRDAAAHADYLTVAYRAATGAPLWTRFYNGHGTGFDAAASVAVSPSGTTVFVTGTSSRSGKGASKNLDYATVAYNAATGARLWVSRYNGPGNSSDEAMSVTASPSGRTVFVTGSSVHSTGPSGNHDWATVAYRAATGARLWTRRYNGSGKGDDSASAVVAGPGGRTVFVTGTSAGVTSGEDWATIAYSAATGARRWVRRHDGPVSSDDGASSLALSPDGTTVYVTGGSLLDDRENRDRPSEYVTIAYRAATGARLWARHYQNDAGGRDWASSVAVSPAGTVFVTGSSTNAHGDYEYATIAYRG